MSLGIARAVLLGLLAVIPMVGLVAAAEDPATELLGEVAGSDADLQRSLLAGFIQSQLGKRSLPMPATWKEIGPKLSESANAKVRALARHLGALFGDAQSVTALAATLADAGAPAVERRPALKALLHVRAPGLAKQLQGLLSDAAIRGNVLRGLAELDDAGTPPAILAVYPSLSLPEQRDALNTLAQRPTWAKALIVAVTARQIPSAQVTASVLRQLLLLKDAEVDAFARAQGAGDEKDPLAVVAQLEKDLTPAVLASGDATHGRALFDRTCAQCHVLFGAGAAVGPELTGLNRPDLDWVLKNVLDPSIIMGVEQQVLVLRMVDGRVVAGMKREEGDAHLAVVNESGVVTVPKPEIAELIETKRSTMPDGLFRRWSQSELVDFLRYFQGGAQVDTAKQ